MAVNSLDLANILLAPFGTQIKEDRCENYVQDGYDPAGGILCNAPQAKYCEWCEMVVCSSCCDHKLQTLRKTIDKIDQQYAGTALAKIGGR